MVSSVARLTSVYTDLEQYLYQAESVYVDSRYDWADSLRGNNLPSLDTPPSYNNAWGFADGAQNDIFSPATNPAPTGTM